MKNREIKFRAWDTIDNKWLFGYDYKNLGGFNIVGEVTLFGQLNTISLDRWNDVVIMQFTGLKDVKGVEIYEGDIITCVTKNEFKFTHTGAVIYLDNTASFAITEPNDYDEFLNEVKMFTWFQYNEDFEVIGNLYEHPHLLTPQS